MLRVLSKGFAMGFHRYLDTLSNLEKGGIFGLKDPTIWLFPNAPLEEQNHSSILTLLLFGTCLLKCCNP
jgi:hypothetical protein